MKVAFYAPLALACLALACVPAPSKGGPRLYVLDGGTTVLAKDIFGPWYEGQGTIELQVPCFLIVHPRGTIMWDTGHADGATTDSRGGPYGISVGRGVKRQLEELGVPPGAVDYLAFSHIHFDHTGNANLFEGAVLVGQRDELDLAFGPDASKQFGVRPETYAGLAQNPRLELQGDHDLFGDGSVRILRAPGHTVGSQVLLVDLVEYGPVVLSGDLYHFAAQRTGRRVPPFNVDEQATLESMARVEALLDATKAELWITHDPNQMKDLAHAPRSYN